MLPDITSQKVAIPAALFLALSPGVLVTTAGKNVKFANGKTSQMAIFFHALVFFLVYSLVAKAMGLVLTKTDLIVTTCALPRAQPRSSPDPPSLVRVVCSAPVRRAFLRP
jgi:hypothetical protein